MASNMTNELIDIIDQVKRKITDDSDMAWTRFDNAKQLRDELDSCKLQLQTGDKTSVEKLKLLFLPTATLQEHSISNGWADEYLRLAEKFDRLYEIINRN
jgi:hypothetical protein